MVVTRSLEACLDNWGPKAIVFLEQRRLDPFNDALQRPEDSIFELIDTESIGLTSYATGECIQELRANGDVLRRIGFAAVPITPTMEKVLSEYYGNNQEKIGALTSTWTGGPNAIYDGFMEWFDLRSTLSSELLRHRTLLYEQRELMQFMSRHPCLTALDYHQKWFCEKRSGDATGQYVKFQWAQAWNLVHSGSARAKRLPVEAWKEAYETVLGTTHTPKLYDDFKPYLRELAFLSFEAAPDVTRRLLGGVLYTTILDQEHAHCLKQPVATALEGDLQFHNPFFTPDFVRFDPTRSAGYLRPDLGKWFVFKITHSVEADALAAITDAIQDPTAAYIRISERYGEHPKQLDDDFLLGESNSFMAKEVNSAKERIRNDPQLQAFFYRPCVLQAGLVLSGPGDIRIVTMHNAGKTLAAQVDAAPTNQDRTKLYENALETLARFHFMGTLNLLRVEGINTPIPHLVCRDNIAVPTVSYPHLVAQRIGGTVDAPRLGAHRVTDSILIEVDRIGKFLDRGCFGTIVQEPFEDNIAEGGIIDLEKLSLGNFLYDTARFLYGSSFERRKDLDISALREHYIRSLITPVAETHNAKNPRTRIDYETIREFYGNFRTNTEFIRVMTHVLKSNARDGIPAKIAAALDDEAFTGFIGRSVIDATMSWDCCRPQAEERMREYCQAAAILVCMGETGALVHQRDMEIRRRIQDPQRMNYLETELEHAVRNSLALMYNQGFEQLGRNWELYLRASRKIPDLVIVRQRRGFETALISDLSSRIDSELQHYSFAFRGNPNGPISQAPSYGKKTN